MQRGFAAGKIVVGDITGARVWKRGGGAGGRIPGERFVAGWSGTISTMGF